MKKIYSILVIAAILGGFSASPVIALTVYEDYIYDETTDLSWVRDLNEFADKSYEDQLDAIASYDLHGAEWELAGWDDITGLFAHSFDELFFQSDGAYTFTPTVTSSSSSYAAWSGRYLNNSGYGYSPTLEGSILAIGRTYFNRRTGETVKSKSAGFVTSIGTKASDNGAWVKAEGNVGETGAPVPEPATWALMAAGLGALVWVRRKRA